VRTLHSAYRVADLAASLNFYTTLGYGQVGRVDLGERASLTMLKLPDEEVVTLELVHRPAAGPVDMGSGFSHVAVQVENLVAAVEALSKAGLMPGAIQRPGGPDGPQTSWLTDRMAIGLSWSSGRPGMPMGSPPLTLSHLRMGELEGRIALVTGSSRGIGAATARLFAAEGAAVAVQGRDLDAIDSVRMSIESDGGRAIGVTADLSDFGQVEEMRAEIERRLGPVDVLVANAGGTMRRRVRWKTFPKRPGAQPLMAI
jgi:lactoylglutathione lyase